MHFALLLVFEGSHDLGPVPMCRVVDEGLTRNFVAFALDKAVRTAEAMRSVDDDASVDAFREVDRLRSITATM